MDLSLTCCIGDCWTDLAAVFLVMAQGALGIWALTRTPSLARQLCAATKVRLELMRARRWLQRVPLSHDSRGFIEGGTVRVRGTVVDGDVLHAPLTGLPAHVCRHSVCDAGGATIDAGVRARRFRIVLADGERVTVAADEAVAEGRMCVLDARAHRWAGVALRRLAGATLSESRLAPGQTIELLGTVVSRPDQTGMRHGPRHLPMTWTLVPGPAPMIALFTTLDRCASGRTIGSEAAGSLRRRAGECVDELAHVDEEHPVAVR